MIDEVEKRDEEAREERIQREAKEADRRRLAEEALTSAKTLLSESHRERVLLGQVDAWRRANLVRDYLDAMETRIGDISDPGELTSAADWLDWCRKRVAVLDPLDGPIGFPEDPAPTDDALRPFLPEWMRRGW